MSKLSADFIHLHVHSHYSLLSALPTPKELVAAAKADGQDALAITDNGALYGAIDFYKACTKEGIKPIIGLDAYLAPRTRFDKETNTDKPRSRLVLLAKNFAGYQNLIKLVTQSNLEGFYYRPRLDDELLTELKDNLICIIPSFAGEVAQALKDGNHTRAAERLDWYRSLFGDNCYLELSYHPEMFGHQENQARITALAKDMSVPLVAAHDVYYLKPEDRLARETMIKIQNGGVVDTTADHDSAENFSFTTQADMKAWFQDTPEALANTVRIAEQCTVEIAIGTTWYFPDYIIESGQAPDDELRTNAFRGLSWRGLDSSDEEIVKRLNYELDVIKMKGYAKYFLVVGDLLREARERGILTTIRGSVAGSLTTYVLGITNVNPLEYKLPFERFLNPERPSAPDIDMDFADNRRDEIIEYAKEKYGADKVAQIGTFGTMMARAAVRDVARALGHSYATGDRIAKLIPMGSQGFPMTIKKALEIEPDLATLYKKDAESREVIDLAKQIEGRVRHLGVHAAGVVIAPAPLNQFVPIQPDPKSGKFITQYEMHSVGEDGVGLLKFDFLGIKNLAILADAVKRVRKIRGVEVDIENIPLDDPKTFEVLARGETMGLFQLNGSGMTAFLKQLKPTTIHDINAMVALYRPGPMEMIPTYIERKHNPSLVTYLDPRLEKIIDRSYGVITYQDDVMMIAIELAGYSWLDADKLRKAMGKKIPEVMAAEKDKLLKGFVEYGKLSQSQADKLWSLIEPFAAYGFNKAHAASYGRVAYQTAYMKANFPVEYMSAVLTADSGDTEKISEIIHECERMGVAVLPPDINESFKDFSVVPGTNTIRFGLETIKNFGAGITEVIVEERKANGPFTSLQDFLTRIHDRNLNKKSLEALICAGAFDRFGERGQLYGNLDALLAYNREHVAGKEANQDSLFGTIASVNDLTLEPVPDIPITTRLTWEKELLGVYVSGHPLDAHKDEVAKRPRIAAIRSGYKGTTVVTTGLIESVRELLTKKGERMAFIKIADQTDTIEMTAFPSVYHEQKDLLQPGMCVAVKGKLDIRNDEPSILIDRVKSL
jgi:DNA polymerase III subunit alpha